ncbi:flagellar hook-basal body complex protein FliE [Bacillaceae bacterium SIJ1]|uniref:flagellar hook-basal body complex protein FliE n=1 Tax=Litoribacterium kuwaitense TaxID=1398745 RepID=UPI0013EAA4E0|nr:flagellar hook-basal body complex protein FliE [Litoribacterium kuwaitense]NGP44131.1 flagellar hook-basal body complex protein FliE [Litoribacterium kuwaitense]
MVGISQNIQLPSGLPRPTPEVSPAEAQQSFKQAMFNALDQVQKQQEISDEKTTQLATGKVDSLHEVMIAKEKAGLSLQLTMEVRNKVVSAYQEVMRMQI